DVGELNVAPTEQLNKALTEYLGVKAEYKDGSVVLTHDAPADKVAQINGLLEKGHCGVVSMEQDSTHAREISYAIEHQYHDNIKTWVENSASALHEGIPPISEMG